MKNSFCFFKNVECDKFPCHKVTNDEEFNCLFCYCPLYHLENCGGNYSFTDKGVKDCSDCTLPHKADNYEFIISKLK
ncbi:MAG: metal-binding protein [Oscillospiraceae bacterium]|nr:metal-binding protein [Oscillospiraceae bacterium]